MKIHRAALLPILLFHALAALCSCASKSAFLPATAASPPPGSPATAAAAGDYAATRYSESPAPKQRPGLGTAWGGARDSPVSTVPFRRATNRPLDTTAMHYNDRAGARAMLGSDTSVRETTARQPCGDGAATLTVLDASGSPLPALTSGSRLVCIGEEGERYALRVANNTSRRIETVLTVDGLDVLDGKTGSFSKRGYVLNPDESYTVEGWRMSDAKVAAFRFSSVGKSYASLKHGDTRNVGVIGMAIFAESGSAAKIAGNPDKHDDRADDTSARIRARPFPSSHGRYATPP